MCRKGRAPRAPKCRSKFSEEIKVVDTFIVLCYRRAEPVIVELWARPADRHHDTALHLVIRYMVCTAVQSHELCVKFHILPAPIAPAARSDKRLSARRIVWYTPPKPSGLGFGGVYCSIDFPDRGRYLLVGNGITVPAGI